ncbi:V-set and immunoglobulin domain-containing protein 4-like [Lissotriton helveticus]
MFHSFARHCSHCRLRRLLVGASSCHATGSGRQCRRLFVAVAHCAEVNLSVQEEVHGTWRSSVVLPCSYSPVHYSLHSVIWRINGQMILARDDTGDHTFLTKHIGRLCLPWERQGGDVSLTIMNLQIDDGAQYSCEVSLMLNGISDLLKREAFINLDVTKVAVTKPLIQPEGHFLEVSEGATVNLTCSAEGSPPITYRWYKRDQAPGSHRVFESGGALLLIENFQTSHSGIYYCEAENRIPAKTRQQSDELHLSVTDDTISKVTTPKSGMGSMEGAVPPEWSGRTHRTEAPSSANGLKLMCLTYLPRLTSWSPDSSSSKSLPLYYIILIIVLSLAFFFILIVALVIQRQRKNTSGEFSFFMFLSCNTLRLLCWMHFIICLLQSSERINGVFN